MNNEMYKTKYQELKLKFINATDVAWRLGYEAGLQAAQLQNSQQQLEQSQQNAQLHAQTAASANGQKSPNEEASEEMSSEAAPASAHPEGSELDQHIAELEGMLGKSEITPNDLKKVLDSLKLRKTELKSINISDLNKHISLSADPKPKNEKVDHIMKSWDDEDKRIAKSTLTLK